MVFCTRSSTRDPNFAPRQLDHEMFRTARIRRDERQVDLGLGGRGQLDLGLLRRLLQGVAAPDCRFAG